MAELCLRKRISNILFHFMQMGKMKCKKDFFAKSYCVLDKVDIDR